MIRRNLLLERDMLLFSPWDAVKNPPFERSYAGILHQGYVFGKNSAVHATISVYGSIGISDLTGEKTVEDMEVWMGDGDITSGLPESFLQELVNECVEEHN